MTKWRKRFIRLGGTPLLYGYVKSHCDCRNCAINRKVRRERRKNGK